MAINMKYFVLKPSGDSPHAFAARWAMAKYAKIISPHDPELASGLREWVSREERVVEAARQNKVSAEQQTDNKARQVPGSEQPSTQICRCDQGESWRKFNTLSGYENFNYCPSCGKRLLT